MPIPNMLMDNVRFSRHMVDGLLKDVSDEQMTAQPVAGMNHPAWVIGHLVCTSEFTASLAGTDYKAPDGWSGLFGMGSKPTADRGAYPSKAELLAELDKAQAVVLPVVAKLDDEALAATMPSEEFRQMMPTIGHGLLFILTDHYSFHLGQISAWRRAMALPPAFGM